MRTEQHHKILNQKGFSLIELIIVFIVLGIVVVPLYGYLFATIQKESGRAGTTEERLEHITAGLAEHVRILGRFPCPGDITLDPSDDDYAKEDCSLATVAGEGSGGGRVRIGSLPIESLREAMDCTDSSAVMPANLQGAFRRALFNAKDIFLNTDAGGNFTGTDEDASGKITKNKCVLINDIIDAEGNKFIYAVSDVASPAVGNTFNYFNPDARQIKIINAAGNDATDMLQMFVIVSTGQNGHGSYDAEGGLIESCPPGTKDRENCNGDATFRDMMLSTEEGINEYDDHITFSIVGALTEDNVWHWADTGGTGQDMFFNPNSRIILDQVRLSTDDIADADSLVINAGDMAVSGGELRIVAYENPITLASGGGVLMSSGSMHGRTVRADRDMTGNNMAARGRISSKKMWAETQIEGKELKVDEKVKSKRVSASEEIKAKKVKARADINAKKAKAANNVFTKKYCYNPPMTPECGAP